MKVTVILCTYNRCQSLPTALESVAQSKMPPEVEWEVLLVDNNSRDRTREVGEDFCRRHPDHFRYLFEPQPGKSHALNSALKQAHGDVFAFMDDDVTVDPMWLQNLTAPLQGGQLAGTGGRILPDWTSTPPSWLPVHDRYGLAPLAMFDLGAEAGPLTEPPFGTNMAFQRHVFDEHGGFRTDLGPRPGSEIRNEDTEFGHRLLLAGEKLWYVPSAVVLHSVSEGRLRRQYFLTWWFDKARADVREFGLPSQMRWRIAGIPLYLFRRLPAWILRWLSSFQPSRRFSCKLRVWGLAGEIQESWRLSREERHAERKAED